MRALFVSACVLLTICLTEIRISEALIKFTNFKCSVFDKPFADIRHCNLKIMGRNKVALNLHVNVYQGPVSNVTANVCLYKKESGYRPFLYNYTVNFCSFMANQKRSPFLKIILDAFTKYSNINHTCPYNHDIIVENLIISDDTLRLIPFPNGDYLLTIKVAAYNDWKAEIRTYVFISLL